MSITNVPELFGSMVFNDTVMKERLPKDVYKKLKKTMREGTAIDADVAAVVATAMNAFAVYTLHYSRPALLCQGRLWCFFHFRKICYNILNFRLSAPSLPVQNAKIHFFMFFVLDDFRFSAIEY